MTVRAITGNWRSVQPIELRRFMGTVDVPWWIAGGWAIDLFLGRQTRMHKDIDVGLRRRDASQLLAELPGWEFFEAKDGALSPWAPGTEPRADVNSLWARRAGESDWTFELMLDESDGADWVFRRETSIRRPFSTALRTTADGLRYLAPEIQLLYKARDLRPQDQSDFAHALPELDGAASGWLRDCLSRLYPAHPWSRDDASRQV